MRRSLPLLAALLTGAVAPGARALEAWPPLPSLALSPQIPAPGWSGFYMGSEMSVLSGKHVRNGVGAAAYGGYRARLDNSVIVAIEAGAGRTPLLTRQGWQSANFGFARAKVGYEMGRLTPYVTATGAFARVDNRFGAPTAPDAVNALFSGEGRLRSAASVGAGFDYRINNNLSVGLSVNAVQGGFGGLR
jgi:opacity protein-like surface antigen